MKGKPKLHILYDYLTVDSVFKYSQKMNKIAHISVRDICKSDFAQNNFFSWNFQNQRKIASWP